MIKAVIFDLGGVVIDFSNMKYYSHLSKITKIPESKIKRTIEKSDLDLLEKDEISINAFEGDIALKFGIPRSRVGWYKFFKRRASINLDVEQLIKELHKEYITAYLSNIDKTRYAYTVKLLDLNNFDYRFASCYIKKRKPDPAVYRYVLKHMKVKPSEAVFIDNMLENVVGAEKVGIKSIHFINRRLLDRELSKELIL